MRKLKLKTKLRLTYILAGVLPVVVAAVFSYFDDMRSVEAEVKKQVDNNAEVVSDLIKTRDDYVRAVGSVSSTDPDFAAGVKARDSEALRGYSRQVLQEAPALSFVIVADKDGTILARGHSDKAGDNMADQQNFKSAISGQATVIVESGNLVKLAVRGGFPLRDGDEIVGVLSLGYYLGDEKFVDHIKGILGVECTVFADDVRLATTIVNEKGERATGSKLDNPLVLDRVLAKGETLQLKSQIMGKNYDGYYWPVKSFDGKTLGMIYTGIPAEAYEENMARAFWTNFLTIVISAIVMSVIGWLVARSICNPINRAVDLLTGSIQEVAVASGRIDEACHQLADTSGSQAASLEETSAALEELSSQAKGNADMATEAHRLMEETQQSSGEAGEAMTEMLDTMQGIRSSADQVAGIIKAIEEIAFQTNLLALNAAVEAARAGEQGMGFAVVAEEVRNLAQRASEAAHSTGSLINESVVQSRKGETVAARAHESLNSSMSHTGRVATLLQSVSNASDEQSKGVQDISKAVVSMDQSVHGTATASQTAAEIATELYSQAESMEEVMFELANMVDSRKADEIRRQHESNMAAHDSRVKSSQKQLPRKHSAGS